MGRNSCITKGRYEGSCVVHSGLTQRGGCCASTIRTRSLQSLHARVEVFLATCAHSGMMREGGIMLKIQSDGP